jgi:Zn-dependent protease
MFKSYHLGRILGFPIDVNLSFFLLLAVVFLWTGGVAGVFAVLLAFASVLAHELGHALVARHLRVPVSGIELYFFGGAAKMGAPRSAGDEIAIAAAGPAVSYALGGLGLFAFAVTGLSFFQLLGWINLILGTFNLIPALPMDGGRIFRALLARKHGFVGATEIAIKVARGFAIGFAVLGVITFHLNLILLAGVVWYLGTAERTLARQARVGYGDTPAAAWPWTGAPAAGWGAPDVEVMPRGFGADPRRGEVSTTSFLGFVIRRGRDGRVIIESPPRRR